MNNATCNRRNDVSYKLRLDYFEDIPKLCWEDYLDRVWNKAEGLCKEALDDGFIWTKSKDCKLFNMTLSSAYDSYIFKVW